jgi:hypothetical protein
MIKELRSLPNINSAETRRLMDRNKNWYISSNRTHEENTKNGIQLSTKGIWKIKGADQNDSHFSRGYMPTLCYVKGTYEEAIIFACSLEHWNYWSKEGPGGSITRIQILDIENA